MQGYSNGGGGPFITVHYNAYIEASLHFYSKGGDVPSILVAK
jgi:hypothetical protein